MKVKELLKKINKELKPFKDKDVDKDCFFKINGKDLYEAFLDCFDETDIVILYRWDYDD